MPHITANELRHHFSGHGRSRRTRLNWLADTQRLARAAAKEKEDRTPCSHCGAFCGDKVVHQAGELFRSEACYRAFVDSLS